MGESKEMNLKAGVLAFITRFVECEERKEHLQAEFMAWNSYGRKRLKLVCLLLNVM